MSMAEEINELTQCPVCSEPYEEDGDHIPRILPCHCTLCQACIGKLLKINVLECPQDRQKHKAERGVKSFSQNKYVIAYLRKDVKQQDSEYKECTEHALKMILYCKHEGCNKALCPMCMSDKHLRHDVVNILQETKHQLLSKTALVMETFSSYKEKILIAKQQVEDDYIKHVEQLKKRKIEILQDLNAKVLDCEDNITTIMDINAKVNQSTTHNELRDKLEFVELVETLCKETVKPLTYEFFDLVEKLKEVKIPAEDSLATCEIETAAEKKYEVENVLYSWRADISNIAAMEVLSDESIVICHVHPPTLTHYSKQNGQVLYQKQLENWARGLAEIRKGNQQCVALSFENPEQDNKSSAGRIEFYDIPNLYRLLERSCRLTPTPLKLFPRDSTLVCQHKGTDVRLLKFTPGTVLYEEFTCIQRQAQIADVCFVEENKKEIVICLYSGSGGIYARDWSNKFLWDIEGAISGQNAIKCISIATDGRGHLFVCDQANSCIQLFSTDGLYIGCLVRCGEHGIGEPRIVRWCKKSSSLVVAHSKVVGGPFPSRLGTYEAMRIHISVMKLKF